MYKQSKCNASMAVVSGALMPENMSKKSLGQSGGLAVTEGPSSSELLEEELAEEGRERLWRS